MPELGPRRGKETDGLLSLVASAIKTKMTIEMMDRRMDENRSRREHGLTSEHTCLAQAIVLLGSFAGPFEWPFNEGPFKPCLWTRMNSKTVDPRPHDFEGRQQEPMSDVPPVCLIVFGARSSEGNNLSVVVPSSRAIRW